MDTNPDTQNPENSGHQKEDENNANLLDNDTYGHAADPDAFKKKNEPQHQNGEDTDASGILKNMNITANDAPSSRNKFEEKGIGGKER